MTPIKTIRQIDRFSKDKKEDEHTISLEQEWVTARTNMEEYFYSSSLIDEIDSETSKEIVAEIDAEILRSLQGK